MLLYQNHVYEQKSIPNYKLNQASQLQNAVNKLAFERPDIPQVQAMDAQEFTKSYNSRAHKLNKVKSLMKNKAITGASAATGNALVGENFDPVDLSLVTIERGFSFVNSGVRFRPNVAGSYTFPAFNGFGDFTASTPGSSLKNDIASSVGVNNQINPSLYQAEIPIYEDPALTDYLHNLADLYSVFENILEIKKEQLADDLLAQAITANPSGITIKTAPSGTYFLVTRAIKELVAEKSKFGRPKIYLNHSGLTRILTEQDANGQMSSESYEGLGNGKFRFANNNGEIPQSGLVGFMAGVEVHIVPKILNTYTVNGSNAVTAQTGGSNTIVAVGIPQMAGVVRGRPEFDFVKAYTSQESLTVFRESEATIGAKTYMGADLINPNGWGYYAFAV
jgi:hypothetical protein